MKIFEKSLKTGLTSEKARFLFTIRSTSLRTSFRLTIFMFFPRNPRLFTNSRCSRCPLWPMEFFIYDFRLSIYDWLLTISVSSWFSCPLWLTKSVLISVNPWFNFRQDNKIGRVNRYYNLSTCCFLCVFFINHFYKFF